MSWPKMLLGLMAVGFAAGPDLGARLLVYEGFEYERRQGHAGSTIVGEGIDGLDGGVGFGGPFETRGNHRSGIPEGEGDYGSGETYGISLGVRLAPLSYRDGEGRALVVQGNQVRTSFGNQSHEVRRLAEPVGALGSVVWLSFLAQAHGLAGGDRFAYVELSNNGSDPIRFGNVNTVSSGNWGVEYPTAFADGGSAYRMDVPTMFLVRIDFPSHAHGMVRLSVWFNPADLSNSARLGAPRFTHEIPYRQYNQLAIAGRYSTDFDEVRVGTTFASVTPTGDPVRLRISGEGRDLLLSWPADGAETVVLEESEDLETWAVVALQPQNVGGEKRLALSGSAGRGFFRLRSVERVSANLVGLEAMGWTPQEVRPGVVYYEEHLQNLLGNPQVVNVLAVALDEPRVRIELTANDVWGLTRTPVSQLAQHAGALAAINGGFAPARVFPEVGYGMMKFRGKVWPFVNDPAFNDTYEAHGRNAVGIDAAGRWHFRSRGAQGWEVGARWAADWPEMVDAMAGGSHILRGGRVHPLVVAATTQGAYLTEDVLHRLTFNRHPRTAIGITPDRIAVLVTVAGRFPGIASGMTLHEIGELMRLIGCRDALELDGGGSTTMWIGQAPYNGVVNYPTDNGQFDHEGARSLRLSVLVMGNDK
jgi:hypothetical protein